MSAPIQATSITNPAISATPQATAVSGLTLVLVVAECPVMYAIASAIRATTQAPIYQRVDVLLLTAAPPDPFSIAPVLRTRAYGAFTRSREPHAIVAAVL